MEPMARRAAAANLKDAMVWDELFVYEIEPR